MERKMEMALAVIATVIIVLGIVLLFDLSNTSGFMGAIGGMVGGVLVSTYMRRYQDERFSEIMNKAARNVFVYLMFILPMSSIVLIWFDEITHQIAAGMIMIPWLSSLVIFWLSLFFYYRR